MNINPATEDFVASKCKMERSIAYKDKLFSKGTFVSQITKKTFCFLKQLYNALRSYPQN